MNYCLTKDFIDKLYYDVNEIAEVRVLYSSDLHDKIEEYAANMPEEQKLIIDVPYVMSLDYCSNAIEFFKYLKNYVKNNILIEVDLHNNVDISKHLKNCGIDYCVNYIVNNWNTLFDILALGVSEVFIGGDLGFELKKVRTVCDNKNIKIRVVPNSVAKSNNEDLLLKRFFVRPEDDFLYDKYIDVFDIDSKTSYERENLYRAYVKNKSWKGNLSYLIRNLDVDIEGSSLLPLFANTRANCERKCLKGQQCDICNRFVDLTKAIAEQGIMITTEREEE